MLSRGQICFVSHLQSTSTHFYRRESIKKFWRLGRTISGKGSVSISSTGTGWESISSARASTSVHLRSWIGLSCLIFVLHEIRQANHLRLGLLPHRPRRKIQMKRRRRPIPSPKKSGDHLSKSSTKPTCHSSKLQLYPIAPSPVLLVSK